MRERKRTRWNSTIAAPTKPLARSSKTRKRSKPIRPKKRKPSEFARVYGSKERVAWIKAQRCIVSFCGDHNIVGHHTENGGRGRKGDAASIVPLCNWHHVELHDGGAKTFEARHQLNLKAFAAGFAAAWLSHLARNAAA